MRLARSSAQAFDELYARHARAVWSFHARRTASAAAASDLTAETFARAWSTRARFSPAAEHATPWLYGIARMVLRESVRHQRLETAARERLRMTLPDETVAEPSAAWLAGEFEDVIADLPAEQRAALTLRIADDLAYAEIAARLSITPVAARTRVHRGLATLRKRLAVPHHD
jgi:RNA polymerase sigma-70 factor (ECF subfamily)